MEMLEEVRSIHPKVLEETSEEVALALLKVAQNLRSGEIPDQCFYMGDFEIEHPCNTTRCIAGWAAFYMSKTYDTVKWNLKNDCLFTERQDYLFYTTKSNDPNEAANAIERYIYDYAKYPWKSNWEDFEENDDEENEEDEEW